MSPHFMGPDVIMINIQVHVASEKSFFASSCFMLFYVEDEVDLHFQETFKSTFNLFG